MRLAFISVLGLLIGCGDEGVSVSADENNFCGEIAEVGCHNFYQCCSEGEIEDLLNVTEPRTEGQCRDDLTKLCDRLGNQLTDSIKAGRVSFDAATMNDCLNAIVAPGDSCAAIAMAVPWKEACMTSAFVGKIATGSACFFNHDCAGAPDSFCGPDQKCQQKPTAGFPCGTGCASQFYCGPGGTCVSKVGAGGPCTQSDACMTDLFCDFSQNPTMGMCTARGPGGSACLGNDGCQSGSCIPGRCMGTNFTCYQDTQCSGHCANSTLSCTTSATCGTGTCSVSSISCTTQTTCTNTGQVGDTCVFPVLCLPGDCVGDPVCTNALATVDYCTGTASALPVL